MNDKKQNSELELRDGLLILMLVGCAVWYKYRYAIEVWFYLNLVDLVMISIAVLVLCGFVVHRRFAKKHQESIDRMRRLQKAKAPSKSAHSYYSRENIDPERRH